VTPTLAQAYEGFLADAAHLDQLRPHPHTLRAYRYELALAAAAPRFAGDLDTLNLSDLEARIARPPASPSTVGRRAATFRRFFAWAIRHDLCARDPLAGYAPTRVRRRLPRPIREMGEQRRLDAAIAVAPRPYRLIFTLLRETGMRAGEALALRRGDVTLDPGREALRVREPKNGSERAVVLGPTATPKALRALRTHVKALPGARHTRSCSAPIAARPCPTTRCTTSGNACARGPGSSTTPARPATRCTSSGTRAAASSSARGARRDRPAGARPSRHPFHAGLRQAGRGARPRRAGAARCPLSS